MSNWNDFPHDASEFSFAGEALEAAWADLHTGDREPWPDVAHLQNVLEKHPAAAPKDFDGDLEGLAAQLRDAWRCFHSGDFGGAIERGSAIGVLGHAPANKAAGIYAHYLEPDESVQQEIYLAAAERAEEAIALLPDDPNSWYFHAFNLGRYSQSISIVTALRQGIGGKIQESLKQALERSPDHAEAHTAMGLYNAEIVDKIGKMIGAMTYGASADKAIAHFELALENNPASPIAHMEYGNGLYMLYGDKALDRVTELYLAASELKPRDAMELLDVESALAELE
jgi:tetratricopeptide (TPR) repeat protein